MSVRNDSTGVDVPIIRRGRALGSVRKPTSKTLQVQIVTAVTTGAPQLTDATTADVLSGAWCVVAPPAAPDLDSQGNPTGWADAVVADFGDFTQLIGTCDIRLSKFAADILPGESAFLNAFGSRLFLRQNQVGLVAFGGSLLLDKNAGTVTLTGIPAKAAGAAAWAKVSATQFAASSGSGESQIVLDGANAVLRAAKVTLQSLATDLVDGATDPVVVLSNLVDVVSAMLEWANTHTHVVASLGTSATALPPLNITPEGSSCVKALP